MAVLKNRAKMSTSTTGAGTITLGSALSGYQSFTAAGLTTGAITRYTIQDGVNWEIGLGTYTTSGTTLTRTPSESSSGGSAISLSGNAEVFITAAAEDVSPLYDANFVTQTTSSFNGPSATGTDAIAIGLDALASGTRSVGIGALATGTNVGAIASGNGAVALGGSNASGLEAFSANNSRNDATFGSTGANSVTLGYQSRAQATYAIAIGYAAIAGGQYGIALGFSRANGEQSFSIGQNASTASGENTIVIGKAISSSVDNQIAIGGTGNTIKLFDAYTLPTSDGAAGTALVTDGSGALSFSAVGADLYAANPVSATDPVVNGNNSIAIGSAAVAGSATGNNDKIAIGTGATAGNNQNVLALGYYAAAGAAGQSATAVGALAVASGPHATAIGSGTDATATSATALGYNAQAVGSSEAIAIGNSRAGAASSIAGSIVNNSSSYGTTGVNSVAFGTQARATNNSAASIGQSSIASGYQSAAYGYNAVASGQDSFAGGSSTDATATRSTALGNGAQATHANATAVGYNAATSATNQVALGASGYAVRVSGAYTLPTADGSSGTALVTNGSGALSFATVGAALYAANESSPSAQPSATGANAIAIGEAPTASGTDSFAVQGGTASGNGALAIGRNVGGGNVSLSRANSTIAIMGSTTTNNHYSTAIGLNSSAHLATVGGSNMGAMALGGSYASGTNSFAAAIATNSSSYGATGTSSIAMGYQSKSTGNYAVAIGSAQATGSDYGVSIGYNARSSNHSTVAIGREAGLGGSGSSSVSIGHEASSSGSDSLAIGRNVTANASSSVAIGAYARVGGIIGKYAFANDYINGAGDAQQGKYVLHVSTTNATAIALTSTGTSASATNQVNLQNNSAYSFHGTIVAREKASEGTECAAWKVEGLIRREGSAGTTVLVNSATTIIDNTYNWGMALSADTTNGCLKIEVTGAASTNIRWVATIHTSELTYA
tara:strand:+ start:4608 stop:7484 length:2877 start_codon:yes stop_codon:yes gene_type:complete